MRMRIGQFENLDDLYDVEFDRSRALQKLLDGHRREARARHLVRRRDRFKGRRNHVDWTKYEYED